MVIDFRELKNTMTAKINSKHQVTHKVTNRAELMQNLLNEYQHDFPLSCTPFSDIAEQLGVDEQCVLDLLKELDEKNILSRVGAVFRPHRVGVSTLAAMAVPENKLEKIASLVNSYPAVNHNYEREHHFNLWFVLTAENQAALDKILSEIEGKSAIRIMSLPMEKEYHIDLGFNLTRVENKND